MKIITYFAFTVLSVAIQFVVMDLIIEKVKINDNHDKVDLNTSSPKKHLKDIMQYYGQKSHALYFRTPDGREERSAAKTYSNTSIEIILETSTDLSSTMLDVLYDENTTSTEETFSTSTDPVYTSTEFDNVTEITFFGKNNSTESGKPNIAPKTTVNEDCYCNLLYKVCDINCCCDVDCTEAERRVFVCTETALNTIQLDSCYSPFSYNTYTIGSKIETLFCVAKINLPEKRSIVHDKHDPSVVKKSYKWHTSTKQNHVQEFTKLLYSYGDPIWLLRNGSIYYVDMPSTLLNNYCGDRKPVRFLEQQHVKCNVKLSDLEILQILNTIEGTSVISVIENTLNASTLNCSTLHCTNWTIAFCDEVTCMTYNKSLHDPLCTESICTHLALKIDYTFHYYDNKIMNASIKLHTQKVPLNIPYIEQEINFKFVFANLSMNNILEFSGSPGYLTDLPLIISRFDSNYTDNFFKETSKLKKYLAYPDHKNGFCTHNNKTNNFVSFGSNKRMKCRYQHVHDMQKYNETDVCKKIQKNIENLLGFKEKIAISPFGNPYGIQDEDWIVMKIDTPKSVLYGQYNALRTRLNCYNLIARYSLIFTFADVSDETTKSKNKILSAKVGITPANVTFDVEDLSTVVTIDTTLIDETKQSVYEYAEGPHLNIHLPRDFFFPFPSNIASSAYTSNKLFIMLLSIALTIRK